MNQTEAVLNNSPGELYITKVHDQIPGNCKYLLVTVPASKQTNTGGLASFLVLKIAEKKC